jgi:hypothetical protein
MPGTYDSRHLHAISQRVTSWNRLASVEGAIIKRLLALGVSTVTIPLSWRSPDLIAPVLDAVRVQRKECLAAPTPTGKL